MEWFAGEKRTAETMPTQRCTILRAGGDTQRDEGTRFQCAREDIGDMDFGRGQRRPFGRAPPPRLVRLGG